MPFSTYVAPALLGTAVALHFGSVEQKGADDAAEVPDGFGFGDYQRLGYLTIDRAIPEGIRRVQVGDAEPGLPLREAGGEINSIGKYFHSQKCLSTPPAKIPKLRYNPALIVLPAAITSRFGGGAHYLATFRHDNGQCWNLGKGNYTQGRKSLNRFASLAVLRKDFTAVASAELEGSDARLFLDDGKVYITRVFRDAQTHLNTIEVYPEGDVGLRVEHGTEMGPFGVGERNLGLMKHNGHLMLLRNIKGKMEVSNLIAKAEDGIRGVVHLHNGINPMELPDQDAFLGIGHAHLEDKCTAPECKHWGPRYGWKYINTFFLFERGSPWAIRKMSPPFCIPTPTNASRCETIQFITTAIREGDDLLLTYGINDCEAGAARVPLKRVLEFVETGVVPRAGDDRAQLLVAPVH